MPKAETRAARQLYLFGSGDGKRVVSVEKLCEATGVAPNTIYRHLPAWEREAEAMAAGATELGLQLQLSSETLRVHRETTATLESWIAEEKLEIKRLPKLINLLESTLEAFIEADPKDYKQALGLYKAFMQTHATKKAKQAHLVMLQRAWKENAGIDSLQTVAETREKTLAAGRAKLQLRAEGAEDDKGKLPPAEAGSRAGFIMDAPPAVEVEDDWEGI